ncbi:uncharacterized protein LOC119069018 [Bradysia coprophila]|uniref:uncharacterized protein LOC119069018 n=1 Tax=Bradysia coprophila TaxID=38358 RepID=UPI00187DB897|nr:uncharacterized protein LOC119069018 [Bradysia coprophila]
MELSDIEISYGEEYLQEFFISDIEQQVGFCGEIYAEKGFNDENGHIVCEDNVTDQPKLPTKTKKSKRRASLTEFSDSTTTKRKNECAKRELNSIVNQLGKIDCQLNTNGDRSRVDIHFYAKFTSFKSNRECTFKYPHEFAGLTDAQAVLPRNGCMENSCAFGNKDRNV